MFVRKFPDYRFERLTWKSTRMWLMKMVIDAHVLVHCALCGRVWAYVSWSEVKIYCKRTSAVGEAARYTAVLMNYRLSWLHICFLYVTGSFLFPQCLSDVLMVINSLLILQKVYIMYACIFHPPGVSRDSVESFWTATKNANRGARNSDPR